METTTHDEPPPTRWPIEDPRNVSDPERQASLGPSERTSGAFKRWMEAHEFPLTPSTRLQGAH